MEISRPVMACVLFLKGTRTLSRSEARANLGRRQAAKSVGSPKSHIFSGLGLNLNFNLLRLKRLQGRCRKECFRLYRWVQMPGEVPKFRIRMAVLRAFSRVSWLAEAQFDRARRCQF